MEVKSDAVADTAISSEPLKTCSSDDMLVEQDGDYVISDEERLPFEYKKALGKGWSAVVQKVQDTRTKETYANKVISFPRLKAKDRKQAEERYRNEVAIIRNLQFHRHVIEVFATYTTPRSGGLILRPAADQGDLKDFLDQYADAAEASVTHNADLKGMNEVLERAFGCLSSGLSYMHKKGIRHKDIKPGNILIHQGMVLYTDFGASKDTNADGQCTTEGKPESMTRRYCAPEVLEHDKRNFAADVFSLGCVFVEILLRMSHVTEHEDLGMDGYSGILDALHALLPSTKIPSKLSFLLDIALAMTARDPLARPESAEVVTGICYHAGFSCSHCACVRSEQQTTPTHQPEWDVKFQRYLYTLWDAQYGRYYWKHHVDGQGWVFFDWVPLTDTSLHKITSLAQPMQVKLSESGPAGYRRGPSIHGIYDPQNMTPSSHYESLDPSFFVRGSGFFEEGRVFSVLFVETAGSNAVVGLNPTDYNTSLSRVKYNEYVHTQVRRFIVVKRKREFCFAVPIFSYGNRGTAKLGVVPNEHAIAYSLGSQPQLVHGEVPLAKASIPIVMDDGATPLVAASRIYFAIHHPIQYNVKVKSLGYVHPEWLPTLLGYWNQENEDSNQPLDVTQNADHADSG